MTEHVLELGPRLTSTLLILGSIFLSEKIARLWKEAKLSHTDFIKQELEKKNKIIEGKKW